jgi:hypothetical protein
MTLLYRRGVGDAGESSFQGPQRVDADHLREREPIKVDTFYVLRGVLTYVAAEGERRKERGRINARLRCIFTTSRK